MLRQGDGELHLRAVYLLTYFPFRCISASVSVPRLAGFSLIT